MLLILDNYTAEELLIWKNVNSLRNSIFRRDLISKMVDFVFDIKRSGKEYPQLNDIIKNLWSKFQEIFNNHHYPLNSADFSGAAYRSRTDDLRVTNPLLWPAELRRLVLSVDGHCDHNEHILFLLFKKSSFFQ